MNQHTHTHVTDTSIRSMYAFFSPHRGPRSSWNEDGLRTAVAYILVYTHTYIHAHINTCIHTHIHTHIHTSQILQYDLCMHSFPLIVDRGARERKMDSGQQWRTSLYARIHTYIHAHTHKYMHTYAHTRINTCIHTHIHTHIHADTSIRSMYAFFSPHHGPRSSWKEDGLRTAVAVTLALPIRGGSILHTSLRCILRHSCLCLLHRETCACMEINRYVAHGVCISTHSYDQESMQDTHMHACIFHAWLWPEKHARTHMHACMHFSEREFSFKNALGSKKNIFGGF